MKNNNFTELNNIITHSNRQLVLPFNFEEQLPEHDIVFLLDAILGGLDYSGLLRLYSPLGRKSSVEPDVMFKIMALHQFKWEKTKKTIENHIGPAILVITTKQES